MKIAIKAFALVLALTLIVTAFAMSTLALGETVYSGVGANKLTYEEAINEFFGETPITKYYPLGADDVAAVSQYGGTNQQFYFSNGTGSLVDTKTEGIPDAPGLSYLNASSSSVFKMDYASYASVNGYLYFGFGDETGFDQSGLIMEFDLFIGLNADGTANIPTGGGIMFGMLTKGGAGTAPQNYQAIKIKAGDTGYWKLNNYSFKAGEWHHLTVQYIPSTAESIAQGSYDGVYNVYVGDDNVGRKHVYSFSSFGKSNNNTYQGEVVPNNWRFTVSGTISEGDCAYFDNLLCYKGTKIRDPFFNQKAEDAYPIFLNAVVDDTVGSGYRVRAYNYVNDNFEAIEAYVEASSNNSEIRKAFSAYRNFASSGSNIESLTNVAIVENTAEFLRLAKVAESLNSSGVRSISNITARTQACETAYAFVEAVGIAIAPGSSSYIKAEEILAKVKADIETDRSAIDFIGYMERYTKNAPGGFVVPMERYYNLAAKIYPTLPSPSVYNSSDSYTTAYTTAYSNFTNAGDQLAAAIKASNSDKLINAAKILSETSDYSSDEKYRRVFEVAYEIIATGNYNNSSAISSAISTINGAPYAYFYAEIQEEISAILEEKAAILSDPSSEYIEIAGAAVYVIRFFEENSIYIKSTNTRAYEILSMAEAAYEDLDAIKEEHELLLSTNYYRFAELVEEILELESYVQIKDKYLLAKQYYLTMIIPEDGSYELVESFDKIEEYILRVEADSITFIEIASNIGAITDRDELYLELARGYKCLGSLDNSYEGTEEALAAYYEVYDAYESESERINHSLYVTLDVACAVREKTPVAVIIDFLRSLFD